MESTWIWFFPFQTSLLPENYNPAYLTNCICIFFHTFKVDSVAGWLLFHGVASEII